MYSWRCEDVLFMFIDPGMKYCSFSLVIAVDDVCNRSLGVCLCINCLNVDLNLKCAYFCI